MNGVANNLKDKIAKINAEFNNTVITMQDVENQTGVAICTPFMKRVHKFMPHSGELVFMDASGGMDRHNNRVFFILTHSCAGGLPLGIIVTTSETERIIRTGLEMVTDLAGADAFFGRGNKGPKVFMIDDSAAEKKALQNCFPESHLMLCIFHILQAMWRWLWNSHHGIVLPDRSKLIFLVKDMVFACSQEDLEKCYACALNDATASKYDNFRKYIQNIWDRRNQWSLALRQDLPMRGNNTNNISEAMVRVMKDTILHRMKAFTIVQLVDFLITRLDSYYHQRILDVAANRIDCALRQKYLPPPDSKIEILEITQCSSDHFDVYNPNSKNTYQVRA